MSCELAQRGVRQLKDKDDAALVALVPQHPRETLAEIHERHCVAVYGLAHRLVRDPARAEEITQEVFLRFWNRSERFDSDRGSLRSFLLADCHARSVDVIRAETSRRRREARDSILDLPREHATGDPAGEVCDAAIADFVRAALETLPHGERSAVRTAYFGGYTYREVAALLGVPEGTVKSRIRSALRHLRTELSGVRP